MELIDSIRKFIQMGDLKGALEFINTSLEKNIISQQRAMLLFEKGKILWRSGERTAAMRAYLEAAHLDPESPAMTAIDQARDIENFFNPDLLNP